MKKSETKMAKAEKPASHSVTTRATPPTADIKNHPQAAPAETHPPTTEKRWNPCDFYYY